jgi:hypothetical protein
MSSHADFQGKYEPWIASILQANTSSSDRNLKRGALTPSSPFRASYPVPLRPWLTSRCRQLMVWYAYLRKSSNIARHPVYEVRTRRMGRGPCAGCHPGYEVAPCPCQPHTACCSLEQRLWTGPKHTWLRLLSLSPLPVSSPRLLSSSALLVCSPCRSHRLFSISFDIICPPTLLAAPPGLYDKCSPIPSPLPLSPTTLGVARKPARVRTEGTTTVDQRELFYSAYRTPFGV